MKDNTQEQFEFFWSGPFSQWYKSQFKVKNMSFNCAEQFMMFCKAIVFDDIKMATRIMQSDSPKEQKVMGRNVKNFKRAGWISVAQNIVYAGSYFKYTQNEKLKQVLLNTGNKTLVEASPYDKIWGIGLNINDQKAFQRSTWQGKNWLGEILTKVKYDIVNMHSDVKALSFAKKLIGSYQEQITK